MAPGMCPLAKSAAARTSTTIRLSSPLLIHLSNSTGPVELDKWIKSGEDNLIVVDVRAAADFAKGHIPGAIHIPCDQWDHPRALSRDKTSVVYCYTQQCHLAANACVRFAAAGYPDRKSTR